MNTLLLFLHFLGLVLAWGPGIATGAAMRVAMSAPPEQAAGIRGLVPLFYRITGVGLALLWITGPIMVWSVYGGPAALPQAFWIKILFVILLTGLYGVTQMRLREVRKGNAAAAAQLPMLGIAAGVSALLAVLFAVIAFG